jgi:hypothetical protein
MGNRGRETQTVDDEVDVRLGLRRFGSFSSSSTGLGRLTPSSRFIKCHMRTVAFFPGVP